MRPPPALAPDMATVKAKAPKCPDPEEHTTWCCTTGAAELEFYRLLLRHPLVVCCGAAYRVWELALHNTGRSQPTGEGEDTARVPTSFVRACE